MADNFVRKFKIVKPTVSVGVYGNLDNQTGFNGFINDDFLVLIGKEKFSRPVKFINKSLINPVDISIGLFSPGSIDDGYRQTYMYSMEGITTGFNETELQDYINHVIQSHAILAVNGQARDFPTIILGGSVYNPNNGMVSHPHGAALLIAHNYGNTLLLMDFAVGVYQINDGGNNVVANPDIFGFNLANGIVCLNKIVAPPNGAIPNAPFSLSSIELQSDWSCGYCIINYVKELNKKSSLDRIIMFNQVNLDPVFLQPHFFKDVLKSIEEIETSLTNYAKAKFHYDHPNRISPNIDDRTRDLEEIDYILRKQYYLLDKDNCEIFYQNLLDVTGNCL